MKRLILPLLLFIAFSSSAQIVNIPDPVFKQYLVDYNYNGNAIDENHDGEIQESETADTDTLYIMPGFGNFNDAEKRHTGPWNRGILVAGKFDTAITCYEGPVINHIQVLNIHSYIPTVYPLSTRWNI